MTPFSVQSNIIFDKRAFALFIPTTIKKECQIPLQFDTRLDGVVNVQKYTMILL